MAAEVEVATPTLQDVDRRLTNVERGLKAFAQDTRRQFKETNERLDRLVNKAEVINGKLDRILELLND